MNDPPGTSRSSPVRTGCEPNALCRPVTVSCLKVVELELEDDVEVLELDDDVEVLELEDDVEVLELEDEVEVLS